MEDGSGILHSSPRSYFLLGSVIFAKDFNVFWEGGQNCRFWEMVSEETFTCEVEANLAVQGS